MSLLPRTLGARSAKSAAAASFVAGPMVRAFAGQRLRLGITGLAAIFLIVLIAAAGLRPARSLAGPGAGTDPLAQLGVAPSSTHESSPAAPPRTNPKRL